MSDQEVIPERMPGRKKVVPVELAAAELVPGLRAHYTGIPIYEVHPYTAPAGPADGYRGLRKWYRHSIEEFGGLYVLHKSNLQHSLARAQADALDYLITEDEVERARHEGWSEPGNEAIEIAQWIFPANAINQAIVAQDFKYEIIIVSVARNERELDRVYYFVDPAEHTISYSHHFRGKKPAPQPAS